ncbi:mannosyltransferase putative-domain-containing protein [Cladochytrium replicatum]|nr:mannosyltransferase putative-domain-containing protein [Cladochytrium replicatum]
MEKIDDVLRAQGVISISDSYLRSTPNFPRNRGLVVTTSHVQQLTYLTAQIELLRSQGCKLPIEVWGFPHEMNDDMMQSISNLARPGMPVILRLADEKLPWPISRGRTDGYHIKAVAILNSAFWEVLYLDVDVMPMKNPDELFDSGEYIKYGTIFWVDYWKTHPYSPVWRWLGLPCTDEWEQESGILVLDRARAWNALRLLWYFERDDDIRRFHDFLHGDKDVFRFSWKITSTPVYWVSPGGFLPSPEHPDRLCGISMIQYDPKGVPAFAHVNFFKQTNMVNFTQASPMLTHFKRYKTPPLDEFTFPPGPSPGTKMRWGHTRGHQAGFVGINGFVCVSLGSAEGIKLETEVVPITNWHPSFQDDLFKLLGKDLVDKARELNSLPPVG